MSLSADVEDEDTSTAGQGTAFFLLEVKRRIKEKGTNTVFRSKMEKQYEYPQLFNASLGFDIFLSSDESKATQSGAVRR